jgi:hypothetical protein
VTFCFCCCRLYHLTISPIIGDQLDTIIYGTQCCFLDIPLSCVFPFVPPSRNRFDVMPQPSKKLLPANIGRKGERFSDGLFIVKLHRQRNFHTVTGKNWSYLEVDYTKKLLQVCPPGGPSDIRAVDSTPSQVRPCPPRNVRPWTQHPARPGPVTSTALNRQ